MEPREAQPYKPDAPERHERQSFHHANSALGAIGQVIKTAGILAPLIIGEVVEDTAKRWRYIRIASVATALVSQGLYTQRIQQERNEREERRLERCR